MRRPTGWGAAVAGLLCALGVAGPAFADVIILKDGHKMEGKILQKRPGFIEMDRGGPSVLYPMDEVARIEWSDPANPLKEQDSTAPGAWDFGFRRAAPPPAAKAKPSPKAEPIKGQEGDGASD